MSTSRISRIEMNRNYYVRYLFLIFAFTTSQLIVLFAYRFLKVSSFDMLFPENFPTCPPVFEPAIILNETIAKEGIALDAENEKSIIDTFDVKVEEDKSIIFIDDLPEYKMYYEMDYTKSHPFENECRFPVLTHNDKDILQYAQHYREIDCTRTKRQVPLVNQYRNGEILIGRPHRSMVMNFECFYMEISGALAPHRVKVDIGKKKKLPLSRRIFIQHDQFVIKCYSDHKEIYHNVFAWISDKPRLTPPSTNVPNKYSIALLIIDSTSRNQFFRHMPLTLKFMREKDFQILYGYTKIGDNSAINLLGVLGGMVFAKNNRGFEDLVGDDGEFNFAQYGTDFSRHPDTIIARAKKAGCATMWNDEIANSGYGLYHYYDFKGFNKPIADYYYRPFYEYQYQKLAANTACNNGQNIVPKWINLWEEFSTKYSNHCHFSFNFFTGLTHASSNNLELYDIPVSDALGRMESTGVLDNTFLFIMGDHGQRISPIKKTYVGRVEERMSMMGIHVPKKFRQEFPEKFNNLVMNKNRLTSNFDIHETMEDIFDITLGTEHEHRKKHGISLFEEIPKNRTCVEAMVPENFCCCMDKIQDSRIKDAEALIEPKLKNYLNSIFTNSCISTYSYSINSSTSAYSISKAARFGVKYPREWQQITDVAKKKIPRDMFDIEFNVELNVTPKINSIKPIQGNLLVRMQYNTVLKELQLNASPLLSLSICSKIFVIEEICGCFV